MKSIRLALGGAAVLLCALLACSSVPDTHERTRDAATDAASDSGTTSRDAATGTKPKPVPTPDASHATADAATADGGGAVPAGRDGSTKECGGITIPMGTGPARDDDKVGEWTNVTPSGISLNNADFNGDNYGAQDVLVDPVRPSDLYAFFCHQGVFKSTNYGIDWHRVNTGLGGGVIDGGKPWGEAIDTNRCRDPNTPPTLYSLGSQGRFWRSQDGGESWKGFDLPDDGKARPQDGYDVDVDPYDGQHLIVGFHEESGLAESSDGGETWRSVKLDAGMQSGISWYAFFIDTGDPATTRDTWLMIAQATGGNDGTWRTSDGGAGWQRVESNEHGHGQAQLFQTGGVVYMAGVYGTMDWGVYRSSDFGASWTHVGANGGQNGVYGTGKFVYAESGGANAGGQDQSLSERAPLPDGTSWSTWTIPVSNGPKHAAVTYDGTHYIVVGGNWLAGLWRYVEP